MSLFGKMFLELVWSAWHYVTVLSTYWQVIVSLSFRKKNSPLKYFQMRISPRWPNMFLTPCAWLSFALEFSVGWNNNTGLWNKNSSERLSVAYCTPYISEKCKAQKSEILTNIDVYSYRRAHKRASCSGGVICRGYGVITCNTQPSVYLKILGTPEFLEFIQLSDRSFRSVLLSL